MEQRNYTVSVLITREGEMWVAQCLEYDIAAQGATIATLKVNLERSFIGQILVDIQSGREPLEGIPQAPRNCWKQFQNADRLVDRRPFYTGESIPPAYMIHAAAEELRISA